MNIDTHGLNLSSISQWRIVQKHGLFFVQYTSDLQVPKWLTVSEKMNAIAGLSIGSLSTYIPDKIFKSHKEAKKFIDDLKEIHKSNLAKPKVVEEIDND